MSCTRKEFVNQMQAWLGRNEADGTHKYIIDIYNAHKPLPRGYKVMYTDSWCATTVSACAIKCGATDIVPLECSCQRMIALCKDKGIWYENEARTPIAGDIIFYDWDDTGNGDNKGWADHVGVVESVANGIVTVIEGNKGNSVSRRQIGVNAKGIRGYAVPKFKAEPVVTKPMKSIDTIAREVIEGRYGNGVERKRALERLGYNYEAVQKRVGELLKQPQKTLYYNRYRGFSNKIDVVFKSIGAPCGSWRLRKPVAERNGISNYSGTASQNTKLVKLAKQGLLKRV